MNQKNPNQQRGRKYGGDSSFLDRGQPSKAPHQDEDGRDAVGATNRAPHDVDASSGKQGISNRPVGEEHAFPDSPAAETDGSDSIDAEPKQQGGNRGGV